MMMTYIILFFIYSFLGWLLETIYMIIFESKLTNRGFLYGPYLPIYGIGALLLYIFLNNCHNIIFLFLTIMIICSVTEYTISFILEKIFKLRWWDYSKKKFNLNGRICLENIFYFGLFGTISVRFLNKFLIKIIYLIPKYLTIFISIILVLIIVIDLIISCIKIIKVRKYIKNKKKDATEDIKKECKKI